MKEVERAAAIRGKTIRFVWTEGPTKGKTHEHVFHQDGTVTWSDAGTSKTAQAAGSAATVLYPHRRAQLRRSAAGGLRVECEGLVSSARNRPGGEIA